MTTITIKIDHVDPDVKINVHRVEVKSDDPDRFVVGLVDAFIDRPTVQRRAELARSSDAMADAIAEITAQRDRATNRAKELSERLGVCLADRGDLLARIMDFETRHTAALTERDDWKRRAAEGTNDQRSRIAGLEAVAADANARASNNWTDARNAEDELRKVKRLRDVDARVISTAVDWRGGGGGVDVSARLIAAVDERDKSLAAIAEEDIPF